MECGLDRSLKRTDKIYLNIRKWFWIPSAEANEVSVDCVIFGLGGGGSKNFTSFEGEPSGSQFIIRKIFTKNWGDTRKRFSEISTFNLFNMFNRPIGEAFRFVHLRRRSSGEQILNPIYTKCFYQLFAIH
jgi:hypothetical protein